MDNNSLRTTVSISKATKYRLDNWLITGQDYDDFLCKVMDIREKTNHNGYMDRLSRKETGN